MSRKRRLRRRRRGRGAAAERAGEFRTVAGVPPGVAARHGLLAPDTGRDGGERARATLAERAHVERLCRDPKDWGQA